MIFLCWCNVGYCVAQLAEHWASIPKVVGSIPTVVRYIFQACPVWIYTQSNIPSIKVEYDSITHGNLHPNYIQYIVNVKDLLYCNLNQ